MLCFLCYLTYSLLLKYFYCVSFSFSSLFLKVFLEISLLIENTKLKLGFIIPTSAPMAVANETIETLPLVADKSIKSYQNNQLRQYIY